MTLRLVLVSMVAALGLTIPSRVDCKRFLSSVETRASSFLAGWDTWRPGDGTGQRKPGTTVGRECELCRLARAQVALRKKEPATEYAINLTANACVSSVATEEKVSKAATAASARAVSNTVIAFEPIDVDDKNWGGLAVELNRAAEGIDLVPNVTSAESSRIQTKPDTGREIDSLEWIDEVCGGLVQEVRSVAMAALPSSQHGCPTARALLSTAIRERHEQATALVETFDRSEVVPAEGPTSVEWSPGYGPDLFAAIEDQLAEFDANNPQARAHEVADTPLEPQCGQPENNAPATCAVVAAQNDVQQGDAASAQIPWPVFAAEKSVPQPATSIAQEIQVPWPVFAPSEETTNQTIAREPSTPETHWGQAVHLTRAAVIAWMKVLAGPALVEVRAR